MSQKAYLDDYIRDALAESDGDVTVAQTLLLDTAQKDAVFLEGLVGKHLPAIIAAHVQRVIKDATTQKSAKTTIKEAANPKKVAAKTEAKKEEEFGMELLRIIATGGGTEFGFETMGPSKPAKKRKIQASESHENALKGMSDKSGKA